MTPADVHLLTMAKAFAAYPAQYRARFGDGIGTDYAIGPAWAHVGYALHDLLGLVAMDNHEPGTDAGAVSSLIITALRDEGYPDEEDTSDEA